MIDLYTAPTPNGCPSANGTAKGVLERARSSDRVTVRARVDTELCRMRPSNGSL
jgi:hypothetical protein